MAPLVVFTWATKEFLPVGASCCYVLSAHQRNVVVVRIRSKCKEMIADFLHAAFVWSHDRVDHQLGVVVNSNIPSAPHCESYRVCSMKLKCWLTYFKYGFELECWRGASKRELYSPFGAAQDLCWASHVTRQVSEMWLHTRWDDSSWSLLSRHLLINKRDS